MFSTMITDNSQFVRQSVQRGNQSAEKITMNEFCCGWEKEKKSTRMKQCQTMFLLFRPSRIDNESTAPFLFYFLLNYYSSYGSFAETATFSQSFVNLIRSLRAWEQNRSTSWVFNTDIEKEFFCAGDDDEAMKLVSFLYCRQLACHSINDNLIRRIGF